MRIFQFLFLVCLSMACNAQGIDFFHGSWKDAIKEGSKHEKIIFVDAYTTWCGPCKHMSKNVFTQEMVGDFFNEHFVSIKIDMEKADGRLFGTEYPVSAYPTMFFLEPSGKLLKKKVGGTSAQDLLKIAKFTVNSFDYSLPYREKYEAGDHSFDNVLGYVKALNKANKSSLKISNDFLRKNPNLEKTQLNQFLFEALSEVDSKIFDLASSRKSEIRRQFGKVAWSKKVEKAAYRTLEKGINYESRELKDIAIKVVKKELPQKSKSFYSTAQMQWGVDQNDVKSYRKGLKYFLNNSTVVEMYEAFLNFEKKIKRNRKLKKMYSKAFSSKMKGIHTFKEVKAYYVFLSHVGRKKQANKLVEEAIKLNPSEKEKAYLKHLLKK